MFKRPKYDVAISVAEEDLPVARAIAAALKKRNITYYRYDERSAENWGEQLLRISLDTYGSDARFVLKLISKHSNTYWSSIETQIAQMAKGKEPYVLPVVLDDTPPSGIIEYVVYIKWENNPDEIADKIAEKLAQRRKRHRLKLITEIVKLTTAVIVLIALVLSLQKNGGEEKGVLTGTVMMNGSPVKGLTVYTSFAKAITDSFGRYVMSLDSCPQCTPGYQLTIYTTSTQTGSSQQQYTINKDYEFDFSITQAQIVINGMVESVGVSNKALADIEVSIVADNIEASTVVTNKSGIFKIPVSKGLLTNANAVRLQVYDPAGRYKPLRLQPDFFYINAFAVIKMQQSEPTKVEVEYYTLTTVCIKQGDVIDLEADGNINVGEIVGTSDPDGRTSGMFNTSLAQYSIVKHLNHAALLYRLVGDTEWKLAGRRKQFVAARDGCIEFQVNDNQRDNNDGRYYVEISVTRPG